MGDSKTRDASTGTDQPTSGAQVRIPVVRRQTYDTGKYIDHKSLGKDISVEMVAAAGLSVSLVGGNVAHLEVIAGTTTLADIAAAVALDADLKAVYSATGIAGTIPLGFVSYSSDLWENVYAGASVMLVSDDAGNLTPFSGKSLIVDVKMDAFAAIPDSALSVGTDDGLVTGAKMVQKVTADGTVVQQTVADKLLVTEKSAASILARLTDSGSVSAAENLKKIVAEIVAGSGLLVRQPTAGNFNCTEASAAAIAARLLDSGAASAAENLKGILAALAPVHDVIAGVDMAINAGGVYLTGWVDVRDYLTVGVYVHNSGGANNITQVYIYTSPDGVKPGVGPALVTAIAPGTGQTLWVPNGMSASAYNPVCAAFYVRVVAVSAAGTTGYADILGKR